jgi:hypothetical protein
VLYSVVNKLAEWKTPGQIETWDEKVIQATPAYRWMVGQQLAVVLKKFAYHDLELRILQDQTKRSKSLGIAYEPRIPSTRELAQRTSSA